MRKTLFAIMLALALVLIPVGSAFADTDATVDVTAHPSILSITNAPATWEVNGLAVPGSKIVKNTTYYSNPLGDTTVPVGVNNGECLFNLTNTGDVSADITIAMSNLGAMTIMAGGYTANGATSFGASAYVSGLAFPGGNVDLTAAPAAFITLASLANNYWGVALKTQTDSFTIPGDLTGTIDLEASES